MKDIRMTVSRSTDSPSDARHLTDRVDELERMIHTRQMNQEQVNQHLASLRQQIQAEVERRDRIMAAVNITCTSLIRTQHWQSEIDDLLRILGDSSDSDRVAILKITTGEDKRLYASLCHVWDRSGADVLHDPRFQHFDLLNNGFGRLLEHFQQGLPYYFQRDEQKPLAQENQTSLNFPLFANGMLWGGLNFSMTRNSRQWTSAELNMLQLTADSLSAAIERQQAEEARRENDRLQSALEKEQALSAIKGRVMRTISHEVRTPLAVILSATGILKGYNDRLSPEKRLEKLQLIEAQVQRLDLMIGEVAAAMRNLTGDQNFQPKYINLDALCRNHFGEIQHSLGSKHRMIFQSDERLTRVFADERLIQRILTNLLTNAIKYSPEHTEIQLNLRAETQTAVIEVRDQGIGIPAEEQKQLFDPFFRAANVGGVQGTGLGLSITQDCVRQHGGEISVQSEPGKGSTFIVRLPLIPPS